MLVLVTGTPGAGKTLWTVSTVEKKASEEGRPVYYKGIEDVKLGEHWIELGDSKKWHEAPEGALIIFDEAYGKDLFPPRKIGADVPPHVEAMATHRHRGHDVFVICQHSTQIDTFVRKMVAEHHHFKRLFGSERSTHYEWMELANERDKWERKEAQRSTFRYPKEFYGKYKSTSLNTAKSKFPWGKVAALVAGVAVIPVLLFAGLSAVWPDEDAASSEGLPPEAGSQVLSFVGPPALDEHIQDRPALYASETHTPDIPAIPYSTMFYDALVVPVSFPKVSGCMRLTYGDGHDVCECTSQQGTKLDISYRACLHYMDNGWFDFTRPDEAEQSEPASEEPSSMFPSIQSGVGADSAPAAGT